jgi:dTDP-4-dehydrorhamnose 3,5-epimerase
VLSEIADVTYKTSDYYDGETEGGFAYDDPDVAIQWPDPAGLVASARDRAAPRLADCAAELPFNY